MTFDDKMPTLRAKFELDAGAVLEELRMFDGGDWEFHSCPVLADASLALVFRKVFYPARKGKKDEYKVLRYVWENGEYVFAEERNFKLENMDLQAIYYRGVKLCGILRPVDSDDSYCRQLLPSPRKEAEWDGYVGSFLSQAEVSAEGIVHVGFDYVRHQIDHAICRSFDPDGKCLGEASSEGTLRCAATNLDAQGNFWFAPSPSDVLLELTKDGLKEHPVFLQGMTAFCHSTDGRKLLAAYSLGDVEAVFSVMEEEDDCYIRPKILRLLRKNGEEIKAESYGISTGGDKMIVRLDGTICVFSASDL